MITDLMIEWGLRKGAAKLLGFEARCRCGHEEGLHDAAGRCAVLGCDCNLFHEQRTRQISLTRSDLLVLAAALNHALGSGGPFIHKDEWEFAVTVEDKLDLLLDAIDRARE